MTKPPPSLDLKDPWILLKADSGDVVVYAMCAPVASTKGLPKRGESKYAGAQAVVEIRHKLQSPTESPQSEWRAWIAWRGHGRFVGLDHTGICSRCGHLVLDVAVNPDGIVFVGH